MPRPVIPRRAGPHRWGFTMVEMLIVISIIGMLAALLSVGIRGALRRAREARAGTELSQLHNAMVDFKGKYGAFPPCLGTPLENAPGASPLYISETAVQRTARIIRFVTRVFPSYVPDASFANPYDDFRIRVGYATLKSPNFTIGINAAANIPTVASGTAVCCSTDTLDPAEAIVFWLGGIPRQRTDSNGRTVFELTGFSADASAPFRVAVTRQEWNNGNAEWQQQGFVDNQRTQLLFKFDSARLKDVDNDGWPEYYPDLPDTGDGVAPYVYFSSSDYALRPAYPYFDAVGDMNADVDDNPATTGVDERVLMARWGLAKPFASRVVTPTIAADIPNYNKWQINWVQPDTFQIICAGSDGKFGGRPTFTGDTAAPSTSQIEGVMDVRLFPDAKVAFVSGTTVRRVDMVRGEEDNLTNFTTGRLEGDLKANK